MVEGYRQRVYNEDMMAIDRVGGVQGVMQKLKTSMDKGLDPTDFNLREDQFGSNFKAPPKMTPYWRLFLNALEDFMLRFLLVCACV